MADDTQETGSEAMNPVFGNMKLEKVNEVDNKIMLNHMLNNKSDLGNPKSRSSSASLENLRSQSTSSKYITNETLECEVSEMIMEDIVANTTLEKTPKTLVKSTKKMLSQSAPLLNNLPDALDEAISVFQVIKECIYGSKHMGSSGDHDALDCDCSELWENGRNLACGEDSDCINRATKMECVDGDCNCGIGCQNTRFQRRNYANVSVIKTEKKGYGLRANTDLTPNDFIFEYIGEVINEPTFRRRTIQYDQEGIKHFYFMSLTKNEFIDATKKGNLGRFCNHSCNPNCYVDKWVVGDKLRMGIFAERFISTGEELVFNYNVDRYGADPQPCYCGELNCTGFIGGKTQTERATKLPLATIEALGIDDDDGWDTAVSKKPRKKKTGEDDEEYVNSVQPKGLDEDGVRTVMATLMQCKEKWIAVKLLDRLQRCDDEKVRNRVVQMHGYQILRTTLMTWKEDNNVVLQVLDILYKFPRLTRNKISDSKIENTIESLVDSEHEDVAFESKRLLQLWSKLEVAYRIPRKKFDSNSASIIERRNNDRQEGNTKTPMPATTVISGSRSSTQQRTVTFAARPIIRRTFKPLPSGWYTAKDERGKTYYYNESGESTWDRPIYPAPELPQQPVLPPKSAQTAKALQDIIDSITKNDSNSNLIDRNARNKELIISKDKKASIEKWRSLPEEKQMKLYENTLFPHIKHVMQKFHNKLPKEDLKKFAKEVGKKLVASDFKNKRVDDPTKISEKQEKKVKSYVRAYFEKAVTKKKELDHRKKIKEHDSSKNSKYEIKNKFGDHSLKIKEEETEVFETLNLSSPRDNTPATPVVKRKREEDSQTPNGDDLTETFKRLKEEDSEIKFTPPPPPPPSDETRNNCAEDSGIVDDDISILKMEVEEEEEIQLRLQEEDLMRENAEAERMEKKNGVNMTPTSDIVKLDASGAIGLEHESSLRGSKGREELLSH